MRRPENRADPDENPMKFAGDLSPTSEYCQRFEPVLPDKPRHAVSEKE